MLTRLLKLLEEYLHDLHEAQQTPWDEFADNKVTRRYVERTLQMAIKICLDIGSHIISDERFREPEDNKDIFAVLAENKVISKSQLPELKKMAQFRNLAVYNYARIDPALVYGILKEKLGDLENFAMAIKAAYFDERTK